MIALVLEFISCSISAVGANPVLVDIDPETYLINTELIASAVAKKLKDEVITSSPTPISNARKANTKASVPLLHPIVCSTPIRLEKFSSNMVTCWPLINWPSFKTLKTSLSISSQFLGTAYLK